MTLFTLDALHAAADLVHRHMPPTPQRVWPLLSERLGTELWVKHENHNPTGAFKVRGGLVYLRELAAQRSPPPGVIAATRGNHGQSVAFAAGRHGMRATIVIPRGNSADKNRAMAAYGAELVEHGDDFNAALDFAVQLSRERELHMLRAPSTGD